MSGPDRCAVCFGSIEAEFGIDCTCRGADVRPTARDFVDAFIACLDARTALKKCRDDAGYEADYFCRSHADNYETALTHLDAVMQARELPQASDARLTPVDQGTGTGSATKESEVK